MIYRFLFSSDRMARMYRRRYTQRWWGAFISFNSGARCLEPWGFWSDRINLLYVIGGHSRAYSSITASHFNCWFAVLRDGTISLKSGPSLIETIWPRTADRPSTKKGRRLPGPWSKSIRYRWQRATLRRAVPDSGRDGISCRTHESTVIRHHMALPC